MSEQTNHLPDFKARTSIFKNTLSQNPQRNRDSSGQKLITQNTTSLPNFENQIKGLHLPSKVISQIKTIPDYKYKVFYVYFRNVVKSMLI